MKTDFVKSALTYIRILLAMVIVFSGIIVSGYGYLSTEDRELIASYEDDHVPAFIEKSGDNWFVIYRKYGEYDYSFAAGDSPDTVDIKYEGSGEIWKLSADGEYAVWAERNDVGVNINLYDAAKGEVETIAMLPEAPGEYQQIFAHIKGGKVYYCRIDYETKEKLLMCYEAAGRKSIILAAESDYTPGFLSMKDNTLIYESKGENGETALSLFDTVSGKKEQIFLPECVEYIWDADIDGDTIALYYYDDTEGDHAWNQTDNIAVFERGEEESIPIFSFPVSDTGATWYAYNDDIELFGDHVLWIYQQNISGDILDHYHMTAYNYKTNDYIMEPAAFGFMIDGEDLYWLSWKGNTGKVDLYNAKQVMYAPG